MKTDLDAALQEVRNLRSEMELRKVDRGEIPVITSELDSQYTQSGVISRSRHTGPVLWASINEIYDVADRRPSG